MLNWVASGLPSGQQEPPQQGPGFLPLLKKMLKCVFKERINEKDSHGDVRLKETLNLGHEGDA